MAKGVRVATLADGLRRAVTESGLAYNEIARRTGVGQPQLSRFMSGQRDLTLAVASRLCQILGLGLTRVGPVLAEPLAEPEPTTRGREEGAPPPPFAETRGRGKRVDLVGAAEAEGGDGEAARKKGAAKAKPSGGKRKGGS